MAEAKPDEAQEPEAPPVGVAIEDVGPARKRLTIEVPAERVAETLRDSYGRLREDAQLPGFRKGHAPMRLIEKRFSESIRDDVRGQLVGECFREALAAESLDVIGEPDVKDPEEIVLPEEGPMTFEVEVEVAPELALPPLEGIRVEKRARTTTDEDVERMVGNLRRDRGSIEMVDAAPIERGDYVECDLHVLAGENAGPDAEELLHHPRATAMVSIEEGHATGVIEGILVNDLADHLLGRAVGDELTLSVKGPPHHGDERIRDQPVTLRANLSAVARRRPATDEALCELLGADNFAEVRDLLRGELERTAESEQRRAMHEQISDYLIREVALELPEKATLRQTQRMLALHRMQMVEQGVPDEEIAQRVAELGAASEEAARGQLKHFFILAQAARQLEIEVSQEEINARIAGMARSQRRRPEKLRQDLEHRNELDYVELQVREYKTLDRILDLADVVEVPAEPGEPEAAGPEEPSEQSQP